MKFAFRKPANSIVKCLTSNFSNAAPSPKKLGTTVKKNVEPPVIMKAEPVDDDARSPGLVNKDESNNNSDLEVVEEEESYNIKSMDLLAELMNQEGTENLHYIKSLSDAE